MRSILVCPKMESFTSRVDCVSPMTKAYANKATLKAHNTSYSVHHGATKMYKDLKKHFWWHRIKNDVVTYMSKCLSCQKVKAKHKHPTGVMQPIEIPQSKWEQIAMDFLVGVPKTSEGPDLIQVIIDHLTKSAHFLLVKVSYSLEKLVELFVSEIVKLHGISISIISDRDSQFTSNF